MTNIISKIREDSEIDSWLKQYPRIEEILERSGNELLTCGNTPEDIVRFLGQFIELKKYIRSDTKNIEKKYAVRILENVTQTLINDPWYAANLYEFLVPGELNDFAMRGCVLRRLTTPEIREWIHHENLEFVIAENRYKDVMKTLVNQGNSEGGGNMSDGSSNGFFGSRGCSQSTQTASRQC